MELELACDFVGIPAEAGKLCISEFYWALWCQRRRRARVQLSLYVNTLLR